MKKLFAILVFVFGLIACTGNQTEQSTTKDTVATDSIEVVDSVLVDSVAVN